MEVNNGYNWRYLKIGNSAGGGTAIMCVPVLVCVRTAGTSRWMGTATPTPKWSEVSTRTAAFNNSSFSIFMSKALFISNKKPKIFQDSSSHRIFRRMHGVLKIDKNKN
jgi:hypothetical protein